MADVKKYGWRALLTLVGGAASLLGLGACGLDDHAVALYGVQPEYGPPYVGLDASTPDARPTYYGADAAYGPPSCQTDSSCEQALGADWYCADNRVCAPKRDGGI